MAEIKQLNMFYSNGNYEAFIRPRKPQGVDRSLPNTWITNTCVLKEEEPVDDLTGWYRKETVKKVDT